MKWLILILLTCIAIDSDIIIEPFPYDSIDYDQEITVYDLEKDCDEIDSNLTLDYLEHLKERELRDEFRFERGL